MPCHVMQGRRTDRAQFVGDCLLYMCQGGGDSVCSVQIDGFDMLLMKNLIL